ncbi:MAG: hypothetical protein WCO56_24095 [Verrucomicrobiota bacterium]
MKHNNTDTDLPAVEWLMEVESARGKPARMSPAAGIEAMTQRLAHLRQEFTRAIARAEAHPSNEGEQLMTDLRQQITDTKTRLAEYQYLADNQS